MTQSYVELQVTSAFSFLRGASLTETIVEQAFHYDYKSIGITDRNTLAGVVRAHHAASQNDMRIVVGCRLDLLDGPSLLAYPTDKDAYCRLSALLTLGNLRAEKGECHLNRQDVYDHAKGMKFIAIPPKNLTGLFEINPDFEKHLKEYRDVFGRSLYLAATHYYEGEDAKRLNRLARLSERLNMKLVATNDVLYHHPSQRELQDVLTCVREKKTIHNAGLLLNPNAESHLKTQEEMQRLYKDYPNALKRTLEIEEACQFSLTELKYEYPSETTTEGRTPQEELVYLTWKGAKEMFGDPLPEKVVNNINMELKFVEDVNYAPYFLTVHDIVRFARSRGILCQGRGSAANSTVCYCLGITSVDPSKFDLLFERFISNARNEPPDIDVDFEHERREEVIQYIYEKYGRDRAAIVATVTEQRQKGAIRDVGRAMGLSVDTINRLSSSIWEFTDEWYEPDRIKENGLDPADRQIRQVVTLAGKILGFPRQLGQHTGGFVITNGKLSDLCPLLNARMEDRTNIEWNKDDIDQLGFLKIDVLGLGMLTCIRKCFDLIKQHYGKEFTLANIPQDDPAVYDMICDADTIGVFQIESRAQQSMLPRLKPRCFYDLVIEVAIVRPGPIQGDMVHPYLRRREGKEAITYPSKDLEEILGRTLGVPLFQEQAMKIAIVAAGFTPTEADQLRRSMATFKFQGGVNKFEEKLIKGMIERGYTETFAANIFEQLKGFGSYGFPESHAASFALLVYVSSWIKCHYPDIFCAGLLNSQPMGFYAPAQIVGCAKRHGVEIRPVDINHSHWDNTLEKTSGKYFAVRLGFRQVKGLSQEEMDLLVSRRGRGYRDIASVWHAGVGQAALEKLADADAFGSINLIRRKALWEVSGLADKPATLFNGQQNEAIYEPEIILPQMTEGQHVVQDYASTSLSLRAQPVSFVRDKLKRKGAITNEQLKYAKPGSEVKVCGLVLVRQRPGTAGGVCFMTLEDETGFSNLVVFESLFEKFRKPILQSRLLMAVGKLQREGKVIHVIVKDFEDVTHLLKDLSRSDDDDLPLLTLARGDEKGPQIGRAENKRCTVREPAPMSFPPARNFR
jgi:error-prone DNA polymerase